MSPPSTYRLNKMEAEELEKQVHEHEAALEMVGTPPAVIKQKTEELRAQLARSMKEEKKRRSDAKKETPSVPGESTERAEARKRKREEEQMGAECETAAAESADAAGHEPDDGDAGKHEPDDGGAGKHELVDGDAGQHHGNDVGKPANELVDAGGSSASSGGGGSGQAPRRQTRPASAVPPAVKTKSQAQPHNTDYFGHVNQALQTILAHPSFQDIRSRAPLTIDVKNDCGIQAGPCFHHSCKPCH
jgi:hypothetical protein